MAGIRGPEAAAAHLEGLADWQHDWVSLGLPLAGSAWALDFLWSHIKPFTLYDANGDPAGTIQAGSEAFGLDWAAPVWGSLDCGAGAKVLSSQLAGYSNTGWALQGGAQYLYRPWKLRTGASFQNLGAQSAFIQAADSLPLLCRAGLSWQALDGMDFGLTLNTDYVWNRDPILASEFRGGLKARLGGNAFLRAGLKDSRQGAFFSAGLSVELNYFAFGYAFTPDPVFGASQRFQIDFHSEPPPGRR
jgi:hypothetical protein